MKRKWSEFARYVINGLIATVVHFGVLSFNLTVLDFESAALANLVAAMFGISTSFLGSRYFVFQNTDCSIFLQGLKFGGLYAVIAALHGLVLLIWTDWLKFDYRIGFLIATLLQFCLSYLGSKRLVFNV